MCDHWDLGFDWKNCLIVTAEDLGFNWKQCCLLPKGIYPWGYFYLSICSWRIFHWGFAHEIWKIFLLILILFFFFPFSSNQHTPHALTCHQWISTHRMPGVAPDGMRWKIMLYFVIMITKIKLYITYLMNKNFLFYFLCSTLCSTNHNLSCIIFTFLIK